MSLAKLPNNSGAEQSFISHLIELRDRMIKMLIAIGIVVLLLFPFANDLYSFVAEPLIAQLPSGSTMIATQVISPLITPLKLMLVGAIFLAMPYLLYQFWAFIAPGLYQHEKRFAVPLLVSSIALFYLGVAFDYYLVFPILFSFMAATTPADVVMMTDMAAYLDFALTTFFAFGLAFEIPVATVLLVMIGIVTPDGLVEKRPYVIVGAFIIGMFLTPPDVFSQTMLAVPMWLLFELGVWFSRLMLRQRDSETELVKSIQPPVDKSPQPPFAKRGLNAPFDKGAPVVTAPPQTPAPASRVETSDHPINSVEAKLLRANRLRELNNPFAVRQILYEVLEEGDAEQRAVARNILAQLDDD
ncbi:twin-arginine translocase subunit TatC [Chromatium okenii]|uniref:twin-arginine translocase subunit TatC n=1 Tax=Chromatium okenii TaxID=61644 RepID=UPI0026E9654D|nr:twin-arginine translocase subunit TatC [Chromatium okenii]MBV5309563.1 twin-arginine translocase subunit TatC [Chromatium okenii]